MRIRSLFLLLILTLVGAFAVLNWNVFLSSTTLSLGLLTVQAPLGIIMLGLLLLVTAYFLMYVLYLQSSVLLETRRHAKELQGNRELADKAEASRLIELRQLLETGLKQQASAQQAVLARIDTLEQALRTSVEQSGNSLSAYVGELEERLLPLSRIDTGLG